MMDTDYSDYSITWGYIVEQMEEKFGLAPDSHEYHAFGDIRRYMDIIWDDFFEKKYAEEQKYNGNKVCEDPYPVFL